MKYFIVASVIFPGLMAFGKNLGLQYDYNCTSENGDFTVQVVTVKGKRTSAKVSGQPVLPNSLSFSPALGTKNVRLYFLGAPGADEQYINCELSYTNAQ